MAVHILGIRHHGPGSARNVRTFLDTLKPDIILVEGPPEADGLLKWVGHEGLKPPVALLCYQPETPQMAVFYPFAEFSPEWQAILYAQTNHIPVRFMDLPMGIQFAQQKARQEEAAAAPDSSTDESLQNGALTEGESPFLNSNPTAWLARVAGFDDEEKWWEQMFENRSDDKPVFDAVEEAMSALRQEFPRDTTREAQREAFMRQTIRAAQKEMYTEIAVICGAWHAPALKNMPPKKDDDAILKGLPKIKTEATWIPWTYRRLGFASGYGAGVSSPGWYDHLWLWPKDDGIRWMSKVAALFRENKMDISVAHVMEAVRLAQSLAAMRQMPKVGLEELNEAALSVLCYGETIKLSLINDELIVSNRIGEVPTDIPKPPLQTDIEKLQKRLRLPAAADFKDYTLDLRKETDLERSVLLHRLQLLGIPWGIPLDTSGKGTFKEQWRLQWEPNFSIEVIEKGSYGNTVAEAAAAYVIKKTQEAGSLPEVTTLLSDVLPAELPAAAEALIHQVNNLAAASGDVVRLMEVIPGLVSVSRYGNVRKTDADQVLDILDSMITRVCISLPATTSGIDEESAGRLADLFYKMNDSINLLQRESFSQSWKQALQLIAGHEQTAPLLAGYSTRLLADQKVLQGETLVRAFSYAMSTAGAPSAAAAWLEGFLKGSGSLLLVDQGLWEVVNNWVSQLDEDSFTLLLPLLRRAFSHFTQPERKKLGEKVKTGHKGSALAVSDVPFDTDRAQSGLPIVLRLLELSSRLNAASLPQQPNQASGAPPPPSFSSTSNDPPHEQ